MGDGAQKAVGSSERHKLHPRLARFFARFLAVEAPCEPMSSTTLHEKRNWRIHLLFVRQEYDDCLTLIEQQLEECKVSGALPRLNQPSVSVCV